MVTRAREATAPRLALAADDERACQAFLLVVGAGRVGSLGESVYSGAKGGAIAFTKSLAREMARFNINVNCIAPGAFASEMMDGMLQRIGDIGGQADQAQRGLGAHFGIARFAQRDRHRGAPRSLTSPCRCAPPCLRGPGHAGG